MEVSGPPVMPAGPTTVPHSDAVAPTPLPGASPLERLPTELKRQIFDYIVSDGWGYRSRSRMTTKGWRCDIEVCDIEAHAKPDTRTFQLRATEGKRLPTTVAALCESSQRYQRP